MVTLAALPSGFFQSRRGSFILAFSVTLQSLLNPRVLASIDRSRMVLLTILKKI
jgi:hypothetical protein